MDAIILAGGLGTRLRSVVSEVPKCMAPVGGKPFIEILADWIRDNTDIEKVVLSVGYLREFVFDWVLHNADRYPIEFDFAVEDTPLGTGGGIRLALSQCRSDEVLVLNGDTFFGVSPEALLASSQDAPVTLALKPMRNFDRYGAVDCTPDGTVTGFREKKHCDEGLINGGVYLIRRSLLDLKALPAKFSFESDVLSPLAAAGKLRAVVQDGYFIDIGIPEDYALAQIRWGGFDTLLLDRDGIINVLRPADYVKCWDEWQFTPRFLELAPQWAAQFRHIFIVTNQRGVGKGLMSENDLADIHQRMIAATEAAGGRIDGIYCCTATDGSDPRRKPNPGMWEEILSNHPEIKAEKAVMVGDSDSDMEFAANAGITGIKLNW